MLKRIGMVGGNEKLVDVVSKELKGRDVQLVQLKDGADIPAGTSAVLSDPNDTKAAVAAAFTLACWNEELLHLLASAMDSREGFAPGNSLRLMAFAGRFAQALGLSDEDRLTLERGALVRDIGKIRISNDVLLKSGVLTYDEWHLLQEHPHQGAEMLAQIPALRDTADIVRNHHECYDGDGYPDGLEGEDIPYLARIMKVLDVYCAMTSERHYRKGYSTHEQAIEYLRSEQGKHFDAALVDAFIASGIGRDAA